MNLRFDSEMEFSKRKVGMTKKHKLVKKMYTLPPKEQETSTIRRLSILSSLHSKFEFLKLLRNGR